MKPDVVICDPALTFTLPPVLTAGTGMDALGHYIEGFFPVILIHLWKRLHLMVLREWKILSKDGKDCEARWHMLMAAVEGGMSIYLGLGPVHVLSHIFADSPIHHGALVTHLAPLIRRFYYAHGDAEHQDRLNQLANAMKLPAGKDVDTGIMELNNRPGLLNSVHKLGYPHKNPDAFANLVEKLRFNATAPIKPGRNEYRELIAQALGLSKSSALYLVACIYIKPFLNF